MAAIGMKKTYDLMNELEDPVGIFLCRESDIGDRISERNKSILAHGFSPISQAIAEALYQRVMELGGKMDVEFKNRVQMLQFPWVEMPE
jgi:hypothetical protein